jgi:hypothetical protein
MSPIEVIMVFTKWWSFCIKLLPPICNILAKSQGVIFLSHCIVSQQVVILFQTEQEIAMRRIWTSWNKDCNYVQFSLEVFVRDCALKVEAPFSAAQTTPAYRSDLPSCSTCLVLTRRNACSFAEFSWAWRTRTSFRYFLVPLWPSLKKLTVATRSSKLTAASET